MQSITNITTRAQLEVARKLAAAFQHGWAACSVGPTDAEILRLGVAEATTEWERRLADLDLDGELRLLDWRGLGPSASHRSGSGTVRWEIAPDGAVFLTIHVRGGWKNGEVEFYPERVDGALVFTLHHSKGNTIVAHSGEWPEGGHERECAEKALAALGLPAGWAEPLPKAPVFRADPGPVRTL